MKLIIFTGSSGITHEMIMTDEIKAVQIKIMTGVPLNEDDIEVIEQLFYNEVLDRDYVRKKLFPRCAA